MQNFDIAIIGAGSAGLTAARLAAKFGVKVVLFEKKEIGGDCLNTGCIPSKSLINLAQKVYGSKQLESIGLHSELRINYSEVKKHIAESVEHIREHSDSEELQNAGIEIVQKSVTFSSSNTVTTDDGELYRFRKCIIATGSSPNKTIIPGLPDEDYLTSDSIWSIMTFPKQLVVIGGGIIGAELAQAFSMLGSQVTIVERGTKLMTRSDDFVGEALETGLRNAGVKILFDSDVVKVKKETKLKVTIKTAKKSQTYTADKILVSIGRHSNVTGLGLENVGIEFSDNEGIVTDNRFRTSVKNIYAAGDCNGQPFFTHVAAEEAASATVHALFGTKRSVNWGALSWALFTDPEIAHLGKSRKELDNEGTHYISEDIDYGEIDRAVAVHAKGKIYLSLDKKRRILGVTIIGDKSSELIGYYTHVMTQNQKIDILALPMQAYPTYTMAIRKHASDIQLKAFTNTSIPKILLKIRGY